MYYINNKNFGSGKVCDCPCRIPDGLSDTVATETILPYNRTPMPYNWEESERVCTCVEDRVKTSDSIRVFLAAISSSLPDNIGRSVGLSVGHNEFQR